MDFSHEFPTVHHQTTGGNSTVYYGPPIPIDNHNIQLIGTYPDEMLHGVVREREMFKRQTCRGQKKYSKLQFKHNILKLENEELKDRIISAKTTNHNKDRLAQYWFQMYQLLSQKMAHASGGQPSTTPQKGGHSHYPIQPNTTM